MEALAYLFVLPALLVCWLLFWAGLWVITLTPIIRLTGKGLPDTDSLFQKYSIIIGYDPQFLNEQTYGSIWKYLANLVVWAGGCVFGLYGLFYIANDFLKEFF